MGVAAYHIWGSFGMGRDFSPDDNSVDKSGNGVEKTRARGVSFGAWLSGPGVEIPDIRIYGDGMHSGGALRAGVSDTRAESHSRDHLRTTTDPHAWLTRGIP